MVRGAPTQTMIEGEVVGIMSAFDSIQYWAKRLTLGLFGPADLDEAHDPHEALKREYGEEDGDS